VIASWRTGLGGLFEALALTSGLFLLAVVAGPTVKRTEVLISRYCYAFCLPMLGVVHFLYPDAVANFIPKWIPAPLFWAYFTGVAFWAAGLAILSGVQARRSGIGTNGTHSSSQSRRPGLLGSWRVALRDCSPYWTPIVPDIHQEQQRQPERDPGENQRCTVRGTLPGSLPQFSRDAQPGGTSKSLHH
jgi:hypothetical protein